MSKKSICIICLLICGASVISFFVSLFSLESMGVAVSLIIALISLVIGLYFGFIYTSEEDEKNKQDREGTYNKNKAAYAVCKNRIDIPTNTRTVKLKLNKGKYADCDFYIWKQDDVIALFPAPKNLGDYEEYMEHWASKYNASKTDYELFEIPLSSIKYFFEQGEIYRENKISGGGGGGSSVKGAIVGGILAGGTGAVIGSRKEINPVSSTLITHDTRETALTYFTADNLEHTLYLDHDSFQVLKDIIPEKEYDVVDAIKTDGILQTSKTKSIVDKIRQLEELKNEGILTDEEFVAKKENLIEQI